MDDSGALEVPERQVYSLDLPGHSQYFPYGLLKAALEAMLVPNRNNVWLHLVRAGADRTSSAAAKGLGVIRCFDLILQSGPGAQTFDISEPVEGGGGGFRRPLAR